MNIYTVLAQKFLYYIRIVYNVYYSKLNYNLITNYLDLILLIILDYN